jgi:hypothetical protein
MRAQYGYPAGFPKAPPPPPPPPPPKGPKKLRPETLAPYFLLAALIHMVAVATRFDVVAKKLPEAVAPALMVVQFPLLMLSGFFEGRLQYDHNMSSDFPLWMRIRSKPVKLAFTFAFIYIALIPLQTWNISIGPLDPTPPESFPTQQRAMWFAMFTAGMFFPFYLAATSLLVPVLRTVTAPLHYLPALVGGLIAIAVGAGLGLLVFAASSSTAVGELIKDVKAAIQDDPVIGLLVILNTLVVPLLVALFRKDD